MLRKKWKEYVIDRELTWKWTIESNAELQDELLELKGKYRRLEKMFKELQVEHSRLLFDMDAVIEHEVDVKCKKIRGENKKLKLELSKLKEKYGDLDW